MKTQEPRFVDKARIEIPAPSSAFSFTTKIEARRRYGVSAVVDVTCGIKSGCSTNNANALQILNWSGFKNALLKFSASANNEGTASSLRSLHVVNS